MKQSEKYDLLQYALWCLVHRFYDKNVDELEPDKQYSFGSHHVTGAELVDMWHKLIHFLFEARNWEKLEEEGGQDD